MIFIVITELVVKNMNRIMKATKSHNAAFNSTQPNHHGYLPLVYATPDDLWSCTNEYNIILEDANPCLENNEWTLGIGKLSVA